MSQSKKRWLVGSVVLSGLMLVMDSRSADDQVGSLSARRMPLPARLDDITAPNLAGRVAEVAIHRKLQTQVSVEFDKTPLTEVLKRLVIKGEIPLYIDQEGLREDGIAPDEPITETLKNVTIEQALNLILEPLGLTWLIQYEVLKITTMLAAEDPVNFITVAYNVANLGRFLPSAQDRDTDSDVVIDDGAQLLDMIMEQTRGPWEEIDGTGGVLELVNDVLIVRQTQRVHTEVASLIRILRLCLSKEMRGRSAAVRALDYPVETDKRIRAVLRRQTSVIFTNTPVKSVVAELAKSYEIPIRIDVEALREDGIALEEPIKIRLAKITLAAALKVMLEPFHLVAVVDQGFLKITTTIESESPDSRYIIVHNVTDLDDAGYGGPQLMDAVMNCTSGLWPLHEGDVGEITGPVHGLLFIRQDEGVHQETLRFLHDMRQRIAEINKVNAKKPNNPNAIVTRFYPTLDSDRARSLSKTLQALVAPDSWKADGKGVIHIVDDTMVVQQTRRVHDQITDFLKRLRQAEQESVSTGGF